MRIKIWFLLIIVFNCSYIVHPQTVDKLSNEQKAWLLKANRHEKNGWIYLHIEGTPKERGFQHGYLLVNEINEALHVMKSVWEYQTATKWSWAVTKAGEMFTPKIDSENITEIDGIIEGMRVVKSKEIQYGNALIGVEKDKDNLEYLKN